MAAGRQVSDDISIVRGGASIPIPDPTKLTTEAVGKLETTLKELFDVRLRQVEADLRRQVEATSVMITEQIANLRMLIDEKFRGVADQFAGRDTALAAALLAQKTSVEEQNKSNALSADKAEKGFTKEIDGAKASISAAQAAFDDKINGVKSEASVSRQATADKIEDLRTRIGAVENQKKGASDNLAAMGAALAVAVSVAVLILDVVRR